MWLGVALLSCLLWALVFVLDSFLVGKVFEEPWYGVVVSACFSMIALPFAIVWKLDAWQPLPITTIVVAIAAGAAMVACQFAHFEALRSTEAGIIAAYWSMTPIFVVIGGLLLLGERLSPWQYLGVAILTIAAITFCLIDTNIHARWRAFWIVAVGCVLQAAYFLAQSFVFRTSSVPQGFSLMLSGGTMLGVSPIFSGRRRRAFGRNWPRIRQFIGLLIVIEVTHLLALFAGQVAVHLGTPSLVSAVESTTPAATFLLSRSLFAVTGKYGDRAACTRFPTKLLLVGLMVLGVWLLA